MATTEQEQDRHLTLIEAARHVPGRKATRAVLWRWCRHGLKSRSGNVVNLRHIRVGGRVFTKREWLDEFFEALANADLERFQVQHPNRTKLTPLPPSHYEADAALRKAGM